MENALSLKEVAELTYEKVKNSCEFIDWCKYLLENKEHIWIICDGKKLHGMLMAKTTAQYNLYVMELVTLWPGCFAEFTSRVSERFGEIRTVEFLRRGRLRRYNFERFKQKI